MVSALMEHNKKHLDISIKKLFPIVVAAAIWGPGWRGAKVTCFCNNQAVVPVMHSRSCRDKHLMHMLQCLFYYKAIGQFKLGCKHIPGGGSNDIASDLS